jgi:hypothetical protein
LTLTIAVSHQGLHDTDSLFSREWLIDTIPPNGSRHRFPLVKKRGDRRADVFLDKLEELRGVSDKAALISADSLFISASDSFARWRITGSKRGVADLC